jgi:hypothetical protein
MRFCYRIILPPRKLRGSEDGNPVDDHLLRLVAADCTAQGMSTPQVDAHPGGAVISSRCRR